MTPRSKRCVVIDTNVFCTAEGMNDGASDQCVAACAALVHKVQDGLALAVDSDDAILMEYLQALRSARTSGIGVKLVSHLWRQRKAGVVCRLVDIHATDEPDGSFEEVPEQLRDFDRDDQKFIAVAAAEPSRPTIFAALDGEWWERSQDFVDCALDVQFACPGDLLDRET